MTSRKLGSLFLIGMLTTGIFTIPHTTLRPTFRSQSTSAWRYSRKKYIQHIVKLLFRDRLHDIVKRLNVKRFRASE